MVNQNLIRYITLSVYDPVISNAQEIIGRKNVHLVDGVNIVENPKEEFSKLLKFLGAHDLIDFEFNEEKGMGSKKFKFRLRVTIGSYEIVGNARYFFKIELT